MQFSNITNQNGLIQYCETLTTLNKDGISSDSNRLNQFTLLLNEATNDILPLVLSKDNNLRYDDPNHTTYPIGFADIVLNKFTYEYTVDSTGNSVYDISKVFIKSSTTATNYDLELTRVSIGDDEWSKIINPQSSQTGIPQIFAEFNGNIFIHPIPNYSFVEGFKILFERSPARFLTTDTTKTPGVPDLFHSLIAMRASRLWLSIYKPDNTVLIGHLNNEIVTKEKQLSDFVDKRAPTRRRLESLITSTR